LGKSKGRAEEPVCKASSKFFTYLLALLISFCAGDQTFAKVYIDIDSPSFQKFPIAIPDFEKKGKNLRVEDLSTWFPDTLTKYLTMTGFFNSISKKAFLDNQKRINTPDKHIDFDSWTAIGAEYLVKGRYEQTGGNLITEFRLYDVVRAELIAGKQYTGKIEEKNEMVRHFAREILSTLTGDGGVFDTKMAFVVKKGKMSDIYVINFDGSNMVRVTDERSVTLSPRWSPDGQYISYTSYRDGNPDLYIKSLNRTGTKKIAGFNGLNLSGSWAQDGRKILLTSSKDGNEEIYMMDIQTGYLERLTHNLSIDVSPSWSPDNRKIAFVSNRSGSPQIYLMDADGSNVRRLTYDGNYNTSPSWSPRGKKIAYEGLINGRFQIFSIDEDGTRNVQLTFDNANHESPTWSPDGRYLAFYLRRNDRSGIYIMNANGSNVRLLYEGNDRSISPSWSPRLK
jgi:TolB protein